MQRLARVVVCVLVAGCTTPPAAATKPQVAVAPAAAPGGVVMGMDGVEYDLANAWAGHPAVVVFYRGFW